MSITTAVQAAVATSEACETFAYVRGDAAARLQVTGALRAGWCADLAVTIVAREAGAGKSDRGNESWRIVDLRILARSVKGTRLLPVALVDIWTGKVGPSTVTNGRDEVEHSKLLPRRQTGETG